MKYKRTDLSNGLRIATHDIEDRNSIALGFWVGVGGRYEPDRVKGIAHFLEHMLFKGSQKYSCEKIKMLVEGVGGALNAFTTEEQTCFYAKIPSKHFRQTFDVLADMVLYPKVAVNDVHKEKTVIVEEIKMYHDLPQYFVIELLDQMIWPDHPLGKGLTGTPETVMGISREELRSFHARHYTPGNVVIAACGQVAHNSVVHLARKKFGNMPQSPHPGYSRVGPFQQEPRTRFFKKKTEQMHLAFGVPGYDEHHKDRYALSLLSIILGGNMSSRLFVEVREKRGLAYSISCLYKTMHDTGVLMIRAGVDNHKIIEAMSLILKELNKIKRNGVLQSEFVRARDYLLGQLLLGLEDTMEHMLWIGEGIISKNKAKTLPEIIRAYQQIKPHDVQRVAKDVLNKQRYNLAVVGPLQDIQERQLSSLMGL